MFSPPTTNPSATLNTPLTVTVVVTIAAATAAKSGNPGYLQGKPITMSNIASIIDSTTSNCATSSSGSAISVPFNVKQTFACSSPTPCSSNYYIDTLAANNSLTINKYASQSTETITVINNAASVGCLAETYTLTIFYTVDGWLLDPQFYITSAVLTAVAAPNNGTPSKKYLSYEWRYVDPSSVSNPPQNTFYTYFSYLWTPLKQKFGLN